MTQERIQKTKAERKKDEPESAPQDTKRVDAEKLKADLDAILDEIDETLTEAEAASFIAGWVQKGGQ
jgi:ubiquitin-like protein Pup